MGELKILKEKYETMLTDFNKKIDSYVWYEIGKLLKSNKLTSVYKFWIASEPTTGNAYHLSEMLRFKGFVIILDQNVQSSHFESVGKYSFLYTQKLPTVKLIKISKE